ncbi:beta-2 adrenergic receptor [Hydra vulgaris]|uniref:Beta-2 adrenergic receptor n=1 Tax=Hydra vulgaris TaxID=6087 RepID=A0ABM4BSU3_HYDVU
MKAISTMSTLKLINIAVLTIFSPIGMILNILVIVVIVKNQDLRTCTYFLYAHLAVSDIVVSMIATFTSIVLLVTEKFIYCQVTLAIVALGYSLSIGTVCLLSLDRYLYIREPLGYVNQMSKHRVTFYILLVWGSAFATLLPIATGMVFVNSKLTSKEFEKCMMTRIVKKEFLLWISIGIMIMPIIVTCYFNIQILQMASQHYSRLRALTHLSEIKVTSSISNLEVKNNVKDDKLSNKGKSKSKKFTGNIWSPKAVRTTFLIVVTCIICNLPYAILLLVEAVSNEDFNYNNIKYAYSLYLLTFVQSILNPIIYTTTNTELRGLMKKLLPCFGKEKVTTKRRSNTTATLYTDTSSLGSIEPKKELFDMNKNLSRIDIFSSHSEKMPNIQKNT